MIVSVRVSLIALRTLGRYQLALGSPYLDSQQHHHREDHILRSIGSSVLNRTNTIQMPLSSEEAIFTPFFLFRTARIDPEPHLVDIGQPRPATNTFANATRPGSPFMPLQSYISQDESSAVRFLCSFSRAKLTDNAYPIPPGNFFVPQHDPARRTILSTSITLRIQK